MGFLQEFGHKLVDQGYEIVPIMKNKKSPMLSGWQDIRSTHDDVDAWLSNGHRDGGVGILCRNTIAVDIDCYDKDKNKKLVMWLEENVGTSPVRYGNFPKCILPYRVESRFKKIRSCEYEDAMSTTHAVEVLADGQQFVAYGMHPTTQKPYRWNASRGGIADHAQNSLPLMTKEKADAFIAYFESLAGEDTNWELARKGVSPIEVDPDDITMLKPKMDVDEEGVKELLASVDPDSHHDEWVKVGMALHHHFDGADTGWIIWDEWSSDSSKHRDGECERRYATFDTKGRVPVTMASVKQMEKAVVSERVVEERLPRMLREWAFVHVEGSARVIREDVSKGSIVLYKLEDLKKEHMNCRVLSSDEKPKLLNLVDMWLEHPERRTYAAGLSFAPDMEILDRYNLWRGWSFIPAKGDVDPWLDFVTTVVADGNQIHANYIISWAAQMVQHPMQKIGVGLVLRGRKGTGKTKFGELLGGLFKAHHKIVSRAEHVTGNFNRHLEDTLLLQADEAYWAGAKASEGALKDLLTNPEITIERKGVDAYTAPNYTRILFTSNEEFVVPASLDERRFAVFDVGIERKQDSKYFSELDRWYNTGGAGALLEYLKTFDLSTTNLRLVPQTDALQDQKLEALDTVDQWLFNCLMSGELRESRVAGNCVMFGSESQKSEVYDIYCSTLKSKYESPIKEVGFWRKLNTYANMFKQGKYARIGENRVRFINIAPLESARFIFDASNGLKVDWAEFDESKAEDVFDDVWEADNG